MDHGSNNHMQSSGLIIPEHFVTVDDAILDVINLVSINHELFGKTIRMVARIANVNSEGHGHRINKDSFPTDDYILSVKDLHKVDKRILWLLSEHLWSTYSFKALERKLNVHQQTLARSLRRLIELNFIEKSPSGYRLNEMSASTVISLVENSTNDVFSNEEENLSEEIANSKKIKRFKQLLQIHLPVKLDVEHLVAGIIHKWFGNLRWLGLVKKDTGYRLEWIAMDKYSNKELFKINVSIVSEYLIVESDAETDSKKIEAMSYSNKIVGEIIKELKEGLTENPDLKKTLPQVFTDDLKYKIKKGK
jgi:predicted transcriptional regulator